MKIATLGTGGIGGFLAVKLMHAGHEVATIARGDHLRAIRESGLTLDTPTERETLNPWKATDDPTEVGDVDVIIFGVKGDALAPAARSCLPMIGPSTVVVPFLNGVEGSDRLAAILPEQNVANGVAHVSTTIAEPGVIRQTGEFNRFVFAERDNAASDRIERLRAAINLAGLVAPPVNDIEKEMWAKFVLFSAVSGVTTAARCTMGDIVANDPLARLFRAVINETAALARVRGAALPDTIEAATWDMAQTLPAAMRASTAIDLENGRPLEIEWISGAAARLSREAGLAAPMNAALYALLLPYKDGIASR